MTDDRPEASYRDLKAVVLNCTLKPSPEPSHTDGLLRIPIAVFEANGVAVDHVRVLDHDLPPGVQPDMTEHGAATDGWPALFERIIAADICVIGTPLWLGEKSSVCNRLVERLYGNSGQVNERGQWAYYGKAAGCIVTGNEDGAKHAAMNLLYSLQHLGYAIPPQADAAWLGEVGPGPSYLDEGSGGPENDFSNRNATFMAWNLLHLARLLKDAGGFPAHGNQPEAWKRGDSLDFPNPEYR
ncbi:NAD(P)H-dependent oxidoreductase [Aquihabitans sp. G128]|uniref:flavodoxin family protein n=1 Tax=Aquihabitans sp. G128 TaxID=2849779 RepID=UPI001C225137|nr:NAD(P)H-dependent oxidoreductase [Aquihabitans sp. G128]QXC59516.1 NAD(P)H-dependent oxidoreductase [Aquihabitans sp. G128]